jgi:SAM-dependent methyltransferase
MYQPVAPYAALAAGYDVVMAHVDYESWADYLLKLIRKHKKISTQSILELGCGTGQLALDLVAIEGVTVVGIDLSDAMIRVANARKAFSGVEKVHFECADFRNFKTEEPFDALILIQDGLNYCLEEQGVLDLLQCAQNALKKDGLFVFDQSTPHNSINNAEYFFDEGEEEAFKYERSSEYDAVNRLHYTRFKMEIEGEKFSEEHIQKAYTMAEMQNLLQKSGFQILAAYEDLSRKKASDTSERIHWVVRKV